mmetsp:Transcript_8995/g.21413  ORF Transcript_8995/g.21413 Transcript_8995/m.21413 type:complete len:212 (+) Transcript_8995:1654-2289(+)
MQSRCDLGLHPASTRRGLPGEHVTNLRRDGGSFTGLFPWRSFRMILASQGRMLLQKLLGDGGNALGSRLTGRRLIHPVYIRQQHQQVRLHLARHQRRQHVIVREVLALGVALVPGHGIVLVQDGQYVSAQQIVDRIHQIPLVLLIAEILTQQQHLGHSDAVLPEQALVQAHELQLSRGGTSGVVRRLALNCLLKGPVRCRGGRAGELRPQR